jgi:signal peptidase I
MNLGVTSVTGGLLGLGAGIVTVLLVAGCGGQSYRVPSGAMEPTLRIGERVEVDTGAYGSANPKPGEIVVFHPPTVAEQGTLACGNANEGAGHAQACGVPTPPPSRFTFIKRVVAGPGDRIAIVDGHAIRNGVRETEPYIRPCGGAPECSFPKPVVVPAGDYFMLGDNRGASDDSRFWGPVPKTWILGRVLGH